MSRAIVPLDSLSPAQKAEFKRLTSAPPVSWPTVTLWVVLTVTYLTVYWMCGGGHWPLWMGTLINSVVGYVAFSVGHDAIHRSISANSKLNDTIGQLGLLMVLPYVDLRMFRWAHILHHRFASGPKDPDSVLKGPWWTLPFRWMFIDAVYFVHAMRNGDKVSGPYLRSSMMMGAAVVAIIGALVWAGFGMEVLMLWFLPSRIILIMLGFSFFWLPHVPHDVTQEENFTQATTVRHGFEWLLGPVLQYQNYHLIHHLFPMTPFYNNHKVYLLIEDELRKKDMAIQHGFAIHPVIYKAGKPVV